MNTNFLVKSAGWALLVGALAGLTACDKYLDVKPTKGTSVIIKTTSDLNALLNNYNIFYLESDNVALYGTDDNGLSASLYAARPNTFALSTVLFSLWDVPNLPLVDQSNFSGLNFWSNEYAKIQSANIVLYNADNVDGTADDRAALKADAHLIRAYSYWQLANTYCLPYTDANRNEPGLPIKTLPTFDESVARQSLAATYQQIEADLTEALKTTVPLVQGGVARHWRANTAAVNGFAARYYLNRNDYSNALKYAGAALVEYSTLVNYNTDMRYGTPASISINTGTPTAQTVVLKFPYTHDRQYPDFTDQLGWKEFLYFRVLNNAALWYIPSQDLLSLYDQANDLRYKYHYVQNFSYKRGMTTPAYSYPGYVFFYEDTMPEGPTVAEMVLIKAECLARTGDVSGALTTVNQLYSKRTLPGTAPLTATGQAQAIRVVLQERRREMPFSQRWFDIRRFNNNNDPNDDVALARTFYPYTSTAVTLTAPTQVYTLPAGSRRFASPLPQSDISNSNGVILQNSY